MSEFEQLPETIQRQLRAIADDPAYEADSDILDRLAENWVRKRTLVDEQASALRMHSVDSLSADDERGFLAVTRSGSMIALGPRRGSAGSRWLEYASIGMRADVPDVVRADEVAMNDDARLEASITLTGAPISSTSELVSIAAFDAEVSAAEQDRRLREAAIFLTNGFVKLNQSVSGSPDAPEHFTMKSIVRYVAARNGIRQGDAKRIIDDFLTTVESGAVLGERVALGSLGRLTLDVRSARKARLGRNPATGEEILIPAQPRQVVPRMRFGRRFRERVSGVDPERIESSDHSGAES